MVKAATKPGMFARAGRPLGPLTGGLPPPPSRGAFMFPRLHASRAWQRSLSPRRSSSSVFFTRPSRLSKNDDKDLKTLWCA
jgi:hypothetical protein